MEGQVFIGTSGWSYRHWKGTFYPIDVKNKDHFEYYRSFFNSVELNNSFYHLPKKVTFENWKNAVTKDFVFSVKASRYITHVKKLKDPNDILPRFMDNVKVLDGRLGPVLFQLPPRWTVNVQRLKEFLEALPKRRRYTFEFREHSWYCEEVYSLLKKHKCAFCIYEMAGHISPFAITAAFVYVRLHGPGDKYQGSYSEGNLQKWTDQIKAWTANGKDVYVYFDNDEAGYAAFNAKRLRELLL